MGRRLRPVKVVKVFFVPVLVWPWWYRPMCTDLDEDCLEIEDKAHCWRLHPYLGFCPFLWPERN
jgi:hypothetical protein